MAIKDNLQPFWGFNVQGITKDDGSANDAFISSLQSELDKTELDLYSSKLETYLDTANGRWLDYWGRWLGLHRDNRSDDDYRTALINHVLHERNTIPALTKALTDFLKINQDHIYIYEPWRDMFVWNASHYNSHKFFTDPYYRYAVIDIQIEGPYSDIVNEIINLFRPAGVYWVVTSLVNVVNNTAPILDLSLPTTQIIESADTDYANFTQTNSAYLNSKLDLATYVGDPFNYNKDNLNSGKQYATSNSSYNPVVYIGSNQEDYDKIIDPTGGGTNLASGTSSDWHKVSFPNGGWGVTPLCDPTYEIVDGETYTIQVEVRNVTPPVMLETYCFTSDGSRDGLLSQTRPVISNDGIVSVTLTAHLPDGYAYFQPNLAFTVPTTGAGSYEYRQCKIEKGSVATPWSPNPSDSIYASWLQAKRLEYYSTTVETTSGGTNLFSVRDWDSKPNLVLNSVPYMNIQLEPNTEYTLTTNITLSSTGTYDVFFFKDDETPSSFFSVNGVDNTSGRTLTTSSTGNVKVGLRNHSLDDGTNWIKLEKGATATPWSPSPYDSNYDSWLQTKQQAELGITSQNLKQQLGDQITTQQTLISSIDSQASSFTVDQTQTSLLGGVDLLGYLTVYKQAVKSSEQTAKQFILANLANSNTQRLELVLQNQANIDLTQDVRLELYDYNLHLWVKPIIEYEVHSDYIIFKVSLSSLAPYLSDGGNFMFQLWPTKDNITTLSVNYLGYLFNAPSDIITLANSAETFTMETN